MRARHSRKVYVLKIFEHAECEQRTMNDQITGKTKRRAPDQLPVVRVTQSFGDAMSLADRDLPVSAKSVNRPSQTTCCGEPVTVAEQEIVFSHNNSPPSRVSMTRWALRPREPVFI